MSDCIPFDIQIEIIEKVSNVKSLIRFRSISKPWKYFIDSSEFIKSYGARNTQPHTSSILSYREHVDDDEAKYICFVDDDDHDGKDETLFKVATSLVVSPQIKQYTIRIVIGACDGLLCLYGSSMVRPDTKDPTVVRIPCSRDAFWRVEVFTLSSVAWSMIPSGNLPPSIRLEMSPNIVVDRFIYWAVIEAYTDDGKAIPSHMVMSFDLITKEFRVVDLQNSFPNKLYGPLFVSICKLRESLVLYGCIMVEGALCCGVWVMEHDASFRKIFSIGAHVDKILGFRKSGESICEARKDYGDPTTLDVYDPCSQQIRNLRIVGAKGSFFMDSYKESLLLLDHSDSQIYPRDN